MDPSVIARQEKQEAVRRRGQESPPVSVHHISPHTCESRPVPFGSQFPSTSSTLPTPHPLGPTSCYRCPGEPPLRVHRAAHAAGRGTECGAGSWCCTERGQGGRHSWGHNCPCTPPQGPVLGTAEGMDLPPGDTVLLSGTPCRWGTELHGKTEEVWAGVGGKRWRRLGRGFCLQ